MLDLVLIAGLMDMIRSLSWVISFILLFTCNQGFSASFDCKKSTLLIEEMICRDPELDKKDSYMGWLYISISQMDSLTIKRSLNDSQKKWLDKRNRCNTYLCVSKAYDQRLEKLEAILYSSKIKNTAEFPSSDQLIVPGKSVGRISLGMSRKDVNSVLATPEEATKNCDIYWSDSKKNFLFVWYTPQSKVYEIMFSSPFFKTADGLGIVNFELSTDKFLCGRLQWRFINLRYLLRTGGFGVYSLNIESENPEYYNWEIGVIYEGNVPTKQPLSRDDLNETGWQSWDCKPKNFFDDLNEPDAGTIGFDLMSNL